MKKRLALLFTALTVVLCAVAIFTFTASADETSGEKKTVVYLRDGGVGDGSSYENAVGFIEDAYAKLDLSKDCTVVVCDVFTQEWYFSYGQAYTGSVTITSCYDGYDYRTIGAEYAFQPARFVCWGETIFKNITFDALGTNLLIVGQHNPVTLAEGCKMTGSADMTGGSIAAAFAILGGYQSGQDDPPAESDADTNITVLSGSKINIVPFSRKIEGKYTGTANIKIGGDAQVKVLHCSAAYPAGIEVGDVKVEITGNAQIDKIYGCSQADTTINSVEFNWKSGTIGTLEWALSHSASASLTVTNKTVLNASPVTKAADNYAAIAGLFDQIGDVAADAAYVAPVNPDTKKPTADMLVKGEELAKPEDSTTAENDEETTKKADETTKKADETTKKADDTTKKADDTTKPAEESDNTILIIVIAAVAVAVIAAVVVVIIIKKKNANNA